MHIKTPSVLSPGFFADNCQKRFSLRLIDSSENVLSCYTNHQSKLSLMMPTGLPEKVVDNLVGRAQS